MTMPIDTVEEPDVQIIGHVSVPPHTMSSDAKPGRGIAAEFGRWRTVLVSSTLGADTATPGAKRLANRNLNRHRLLAAVYSSVTNAGQTVAQTFNTVTGPGAGATIATLGVLPAGVYNIAWIVGYGAGAVAAAELNNMRLNANGAAVLTAQIPATANTQATQPSVTVVANGSSPITITAIGAGTGTANYQGTLVATAQGQPASDGVILGSREECSSGGGPIGVPMLPGQVGGYVPIGQSFRWEVQAELWVAYPQSNVSPVYVTISDEVFAAQTLGRSR